MITEPPEGSVRFDMNGIPLMIIMEGDYRDWLCEKHADGYWVTVSELDAEGFRNFAREFDQRADYEYEIGNPASAGQYSLKSDRMRRKADAKRKEASA